MLESVKRAYDAKLFENDQIICPVDLETIEVYLQILAPAYRVSVGFQRNLSTISEVIPSIATLLVVWRTLDVPPEPKRLCKLLVLTTNYKFKSELNSSVYKVYLLYF